MTYQSVFISLSELILKTMISSSSTTKNWTFKSNFGRSTNQEWLSSHRLTLEPNLNWNSFDHNTTIMTNLLSHNQDNILNRYRLQPVVNFNQPPHTHNAQTITNLIKISFSQHNLFTSLSYKNMIFRHQVLIKGEFNLSYPKKKWLSKHPTSDTLQNTEPLTTLLDNCNSSLLLYKFS